MCEITIDVVNGFGANGTSVGVLGTVVDCRKPFEGDQVSVEITCNDSTSTRSATVYNNGQWYAEFPEIACRCGQPITVTARCVTDPECEPAVREFERLECIDCPDISFTGGNDDVGQVVQIECLPDQRALVKYDYTFTNTLNFIVFVNVDCGPQGMGVSGTNTGFTPGSTSTETVECIVETPSAPQLIFTFSRFDGTLLACPPVVVDIRFIERCPCQDDNLPDVTVRVSGCTAIFTRGRFSDDCTVIWNFGDGSSLVSDSSLSVLHTYDANGTYSVGATLQCGDCVYPLNIPDVEITDCEPEVVMPDPDTDNDDSDDDAPWFCGFLSAVAAVSVGMAVFAAVMIICIPAATVPLLIAAAISGFVGLIVGIIVSLFCPTPCGSALLRSAQGIMAAGSALVTFSACCPWVLLVGILVIAAGVGTLLLWKRQCSISNCAAAKEVAWVFVVLVPQISAAIFAIPALQPCNNLTADVILGTLYAIIAGYALGCND